MSNAEYSPLPPELEPREIDARSIHAFRHDFPSPLVRWHLHHDYELHLITASAGRMFVGDHIGPFSPEQLVLTGPCLPHNWVSLSEPGTVVERRDHVVQFRRDLVRSMAAFAPELDSLLPLLERARHGIEFGGAVCRDAEAWFDDIIASEGSRRIGLLIEFLGRLSRERDYRTLSDAPPRPDTDGVPLDRLDIVIRHVDEHHADPIPIAAVSGLLGMSDTAFSHFFTRLTGHTFTQFVIRVRVARACELLSTSERPVTEICHAVGFNNAANFNRRFRELKNLTPREYRKQARLGHVTSRGRAGR